MQETIGRDSSTSQPSSWPGEHHHDGSHFTLITFPDGKMILVTPDNLTEEQFQGINTLFNDWASVGSSFPLVIGNCHVQMASVRPRNVEVIRESTAMG